MKRCTRIFTVFTALAAALAFAACGTEPSAPISGPSLSVQEAALLPESGVLTLSVNPELQLRYDREGLVTDLAGLNADGEAIAEASRDGALGRPCAQVLPELVDRISEAGYFLQEVDGSPRNIILQLEPGSVLPEKDFLEELSASTRQAVEKLSLSSGIVTIDTDDYDRRYESQGRPSPYITLEKAQEIALTQAGVDAADARFEEREFDFDHGAAVYELEFTAGGQEYEYDVDALTGKILKAGHGTAGTQWTPSYAATNYTNYTNYGATSYTNYTNYDDGGTTNYTNYDDDSSATNYTNYTNYDDGGTTNYTNYGSTNYDDGGATNYTNYGDSAYGSSDYGR